MLTLEGLEDLVPTLKFGSEMESTLHYANSDDAREGGAFTRLWNPWICSPISTQERQEALAIL